MKKFIFTIAWQTLLGSTICTAIIVTLFNLIASGQNVFHKGEDPAVTLHYDSKKDSLFIIRQGDDCSEVNFGVNLDSLIKLNDSLYELGYNASFNIDYDTTTFHKLENPDFSRFYWQEFDTSIALDNDKWQNSKAIFKPLINGYYATKRVDENPYGLSILSAKVHYIYEIPESSSRLANYFVTIKVPVHRRFLSIKVDSTATFNFIVVEPFMFESQEEFKDWCIAFFNTINLHYELWRKEATESGRVIFY